MPSYKLSPLAEEDLFQLISSTIELWGNEQAKIYAQTIDAALVKLAQYPDFGRQRDELYNNAKSFPVESILCFIRLVKRVLKWHASFISAWINQNTSNGNNLSVNIL